MGLSVTATGTRTCRDCGESDVDFYRAENICRPCRNGRYRRWAADNKDRRAVINRRALLRSYGLTEAEYGRMLERQSGVCAICSTAPEDSPHSRLYVDHDHSTGAVRGLLCGHCNRGLGAFRDTPEFLDNAKEYLNAAACR